MYFSTVVKKELRDAFKAGISQIYPFIYQQKGCGAAVRVINDGKNFICSIAKVDKSYNSVVTRSAFMALFEKAINESNTIKIPIDSKKPEKTAIEFFESL